MAKKQLEKINKRIKANQSKANVEEWSRVLSEVFLAVEESDRTPLMLKKWDNGIKSAIVAGIAELLVSGSRSEVAPEMYNTLVEKIASHDKKRMSTWLPTATADGQNLKSCCKNAEEAAGA
jgi:gamma-glutamyl-gamma-aminobutyrate hydrolase PuuD